MPIYRRLLLEESRKAYGRDASSKESANVNLCRICKVPGFYPHAVRVFNMFIPTIDPLVNGF